MGKGSGRWERERLKGKGRGKESGRREEEKTRIKGEVGVEKTYTF